MEQQISTADGQQMTVMQTVPATAPQQVQVCEPNIYRLFWSQITKFIFINQENRPNTWL